jgi:hypothetical protein
MFSQTQHFIEMLAEMVGDDQCVLGEHHCTVQCRDGIQAEVAELKRLGGAGLARELRGELG